jgi:hypothetical protein
MKTQTEGLVMMKCCEKVNSFAILRFKGQGMHSLLGVGMFSIATVVSFLLCSLFMAVECQGYPSLRSIVLYVESGE